MNIDLQTFLQLPQAEFSALVAESGPLVAVFPINGTRRWYLLKCLAGEFDAQRQSYLQVMEERHIAMYRLFFEQGVHTLLTPIFGPDLLDRGDDYLRLSIEGIARLVSEPHFLNFYDQFQVRVRFYGDYRRFLEATPYAWLIERIDEISQRTAGHTRNRLFFGMFANDPSEQLAAFGAQYFQQHQQLPNRDTLVRLYYGEYVDPVSFFIGFDRLSAFDMPLLATGSEDLYFTVSPSLELTARQLREILYDHLYLRKTPEPDYETLPTEALTWMANFYSENKERTLGVGRLVGGIWYPQPGLTWPESAKEPGGQA